MITLHPLRSDALMEIGAPFAVPASVEARVDAIWAEEKARCGDRLTNGRIFALQEHAPDRLLIQPAEYRFVVARRRAPGLVAIRPLAVTGVLFCADGVVLGRRGGGVAADAGVWELAPAGGLSSPDPEGQINEELHEELGVEAGQIMERQVIGLAEDRESGVIDILYRLRTALSGEAVRAAHAAHATDEYSELAILPPTGLGEFLDKNSEALLPALRPMLRLAGLLP